MMIGTSRVSRAHLHAAADLDSRHARQHPVEHDEVGRVLLDEQQRLVAGLGAGDREALGLEVVGEHLALRRLVLDDEDLGLCRSAHETALPPMKEVRSPLGRSSSGISPVTR